MTILEASFRERVRFFRFAVVGAMGAVVDFGVMNLLVLLMHLPLVAAGTLSFIAAVISNFTWNRYWTYPDSRTKAIPLQLAEFVLVSIAGLVIRVPILYYVEPLLTRLVANLSVLVRLFPAPVLSRNLTLAVAVGIVMMWNFFINRYWTYGDVKQP